ncbi:MAG TPA: inositol monophosphatase family protein [Gaiellales bacterium]
MTGHADDLALARELALLGGAIALERYRNHPPATRKGDGSWVTEADVAAEQAIRSRLAEARPDHNVLGEEDGLHAADGSVAIPGRPTWVVDPIDGTHSYMIGIPLWATLVGLVIDGGVVVGVCHAPGLGETYEASAGGGARMNGEPIAVRATPMDEAMVVSGGLRSMQEHGLESFYRELSAAAWRVRGLGDFWGHVLVARGAAQIMVDPTARTWDTTAVEVIVREAGGTVTQVDGSPIADGSTCVSTCGGALHAEVLAMAAHQ